jgi:hypothetical protein
VNSGLWMWDTKHDEFAGLEHVGVPQCEEGR